MAAGDIYFVYKPNYITTVGGVVPAAPSNDTTTKLGLAVHRGYYLGKTQDPEFLLKIKEHNPIICSEDVANGFPLIGVSQIPNNPMGGDPSDTRPLTDEETRVKIIATIFIDKISTRAKVLGLVGNNEDIITDLFKHVYLLDRIVIALADTLQDSSVPIPAEITTLLSTIKTQLNVTPPIDPVGTLTAAGKTYDELYTKLIGTTKTINDIVAEYYTNMATLMASIPSSGGSGDTSGS